MLRSANELTGYVLKAEDGDIGRCKDFLFDDDRRTVRCMVVDTRNWLPGRKVLLSPLWLDTVDWITRKVHVDLDKDQIKNSPEYRPSAPVNRDYEARLYDYYGRPRYW